MTRYNEKIVETFIRDFPHAFLRENLKFLSQQPTLEGYRPDLIFEDCSGIPVVVEVQIGRLDRSHLYKSLEYRDFLLEQRKCTRVRVVLFSNQITDRYRRLLGIHGVESVVISKEEFLSKAERLSPGSTISGIDFQKRGDMPFTTSAEEIFMMLSAKVQPYEGIEIADAIVFWTRNWPSQYDSVHLTSSLFVRDRQTEFSISAPIETRVSSEIADLSVEQLYEIKLWTEVFLAFRDAGDAEVGEVVLGQRSQDDPYKYEEYLYGSERKKLLRRIWSRFGLDQTNTLNARKIRDSLCTFKRVALLAGEFPNLRPVSFCNSFDVRLDPGQLLTQGARINNRTEDQELEKTGTRSLLVPADGKWVTVRAVNLDESFLAAVRDLTDHLMHHANKDLNKLVLNKKCMFCLRKPAKINSLNSNGLLLSSRFFDHI